MTVPTDLLYTEDHEWVRIGDDEIAIVGITHFAQDQLGAIVFVELPDEGDEVSQNDPVGQVESTKSVSDIFAPVSGTIIEINRALNDAPELINTDPYEDGWILKLKLEDPDEKDELMRPEEYQDHVGDE
mgnify:CR=1 FL=1